MSVDEGEGVGTASYGSNEQDIAVLAPVGNTLENRLKIILSLVLISKSFLFYRAGVQRGQPFGGL